MIQGAVKHALFGLGHYARRLRRTAFPGVAVLCYHGIDADDAPAAPLSLLHVRESDFDAQCRFLREACDPISLDDWRAALATGRLLPPRAVLLTFDDGYRSVLTRAAPALARHGLPAVVFVSSGPVQERRLFWFDALAREKGEAAVEAAKAWTADQWKGLAPKAPEHDDDPGAPLTIEELKRLAAQPGIEIGGHGISHCILSRAPVAEQRREIEDGRRALESWTGAPVRAFAYPNGRPGQDYDAGTVALVAAAGFDHGFSTRPGFARPGEPALERSRFLMLASVSAPELAHRLAYSWHAPGSAS